MAQADRDQSGADVAVAVAVQEIRERHPVAVREVAASWERGLQGLLGLVGIAGLAGAPLASGRLSETTQVVLGILLGVVLVVAGMGFVLVMSAAYGSVGLVPAPTSTAERARLAWSLAERGRRRLVWGRRLAIGALVLFSAGVVVAWLDPGQGSTERLWVETTRGVTHCGPVIDAPRGAIAVRTDAEGRVEIPTDAIDTIEVVTGCSGGAE